MMKFLLGLCQVIGHHLFPTDPANFTFSFLLTISDKEIPDANVSHLLPSGCPPINLQQNTTLIIL